MFQIFSSIEILTLNSPSSSHLSRTATYFNQNKRIYPVPYKHTKQIILVQYYRKRSRELLSQPPIILYELNRSFLGCYNTKRISPQFCKHLGYLATAQPMSKFEWSLQCFILDGNVEIFFIPFYQEPQ